MSRRRNRATDSLGPVLIRVIHAANCHGRPDVGKALAAYGRYAISAIPTQGVLPRTDHELYGAIEKTARKYLGFTEARQAFLHTMEAIEPLERRDAIETAEVAFQSVSDDAHFFAGLAFGITLVDMVGAGW